MAKQIEGCQLALLWKSLPSGSPVFGWLVGWPIEETVILIGIVTQESAACDQPRVPVHMLGIQVTHHEDGKPTAKAGRQAGPKEIEAVRAIGKQP